MRSPSRLRLWSCVLASSVAAFGAAAKDPVTPKDPAPAIAAKKLELHVDRTPLGDTKGAAVLSYADVVEPVEKSVVSVSSTKTVHRAPNPYRQLFGDNTPDEGKEEGLGSGVIVSADGYILTNNHVVEGADELKVTLNDDQEFTAKVIGADPKTDIAVIKIDATALPAITLADSDRLRVGDVVFAIGNPLGVGQTVTSGIVSAKGRNKLGLLDSVAGYENFIQTDAAINMGNSGGALIDARGRLVGINSAILSTSRGSIGIGFAIPANLAASIIHSLVETGTVARGYLGVSTETITPDLAEQMGLEKDGKGVAITDVTPADGPAAKAGLKRNDAIISVDGKPVTSVEELRLMIAQTSPGSVVKLKLIRDGKEKLVTVALGAVAEKAAEFLAGVETAKLKDEDRRRLGITDPRLNGLLITDVSEDSPYKERLAPQMVIVEIDRVPVTDNGPGLSALPPGRHLLLVYFHSQLRFIGVNVKK